MLAVQAVLQRLLPWVIMVGLLGPAEPTRSQTAAGDAAAPVPAIAPAAPAGAVELLDPDDPRAKDGYLVGARGVDPGWKDTRVNERNPNMYGQTGLRRTTSARTGKDGYFDLALSGRWFVSDDFIRPGVADRNQFFGGNLAFGFTPFDFLEVSLATQLASNANDSAVPQTLFTTGDLLPSVKLSWHFLPFALGIDVRGLLPTTQDQIGLDAGNFALTATGLVTLDLYQEADIPLRAHVNVGYTYQNGRATADARNYLLRGVEGTLLALTTQSWFYDQLFLGLALEAPLPYVTPFVELSSQTALGVKAGNGPAGGPYDVMRDSTIVITPGLRGTVGRGLAFDVSLDLGMGGTAGGLKPDVNNVVVGQPYNPAWAVQFGLSYTFNPFLAETQVELRETARPQGLVEGCVTSNARPLTDAIIEYAGTAGPRIVVDERGCFRSPRIDAGPLLVRVTHLEHKPASMDIVILANEVVRADIAMVPAPRLGRFRGDVVNADDQAVEAHVDVTLDGQVVQAQSAAGGAFNITLPPGKYQAVVKAAGYFQQGSALVIEPLGTTTIHFTLKKLPSKRLTELTRDKIEISTRIPFELGKARLLKASEFVLDDVVDVLLQNPQIGKVRVEGHSDSTGDDSVNGLLSQQRAESVMEYLIARGVPASRLAAQGYGHTRPIASNETDDGRAKNRRVEFVLVGEGAP